MREDLPPGDKLSAISSRFKAVADTLIHEGTDPAMIVIAQLVPLVTLTYAMNGANRATTRDTLSEMLDNVIGIVDDAARRHGIQQITEKIVAAEKRGDHREAMRLVGEAQAAANLK